MIRKILSDSGIKAKLFTPAILNIEVLKLDLLHKLGTPIELLEAFGDKLQDIKAIKELEQEFYKTRA